MQLKTWIGSLVLQTSQNSGLSFAMKYEAQVSLCIQTSKSIQWKVFLINTNNSESESVMGSQSLLV